MNIKNIRARIAKSHHHLHRQVDQLSFSLCQGGSFLSAPEGDILRLVIKIAIVCNQLTGHAKNWISILRGLQHIMTMS